MQFLQLDFIRSDRGLQIMPEKLTNGIKAPKTLPFEFVPQEAETAVLNNPHAKATTLVDDVLDAMEASFGTAVLERVVYAGERTVRISTDSLLEICTWLKETQGFTYLADLAGIDRFTEEDRYEVFYNLVNMTKGKRLRVVIRIDEESMTAPTLCDIFPAANWNEREAWDMFGLRFEGHPDLRRMFMPEDFEYHPLRKEFPLLGVPGSMALPPQVPTGELTQDPFPAAHGSKTPWSFEEVESEDDV
jgi:NADH-quinone oxidoreductase subunit C